jgi:hypothetical protein
LTLDFAIERTSSITGGGTEATGSARVVLTGVNELGMITESSAGGSLESFRLVTQASNGLDTGTFEARLVNPTSGIFETRLENPVSGDPGGTVIRFDSGVPLPVTCVGSASICFGTAETVTLVGVSLTIGLPGAGEIGALLSGESVILGAAFGRETARAFVPGSGNVPEPLAGTMLLLGLCTHALRTTWRKARGLRS